MAEIWFSSDLHLGHANIIKFCNRPFKDPAEMNAFLLETHNSYVKPQDHWYNLGDVTMQRGDKPGEFLKLIAQFNGHKRLIMGNHDHYPAGVYLQFFEKVMAMQMFDNIRFTHIPIHPTSMGGAIANVHGHIHDQDSPEPLDYLDSKGLRVIKPYVNVSIERTAYRPVTLGEIKDLIKKAKEDYLESLNIGEKL